jgi:hypothetical protein
VEGDSFVHTKKRIRAVLTANFVGPRRNVEHYEKFMQLQSVGPGPIQTGRRIQSSQAAEHPLDQYRADIEKFRKAAEDV